LILKSTRYSQMTKDPKTTEIYKKTLKMIKVKMEDIFKTEEGFREDFPLSSLQLCRDQLDILVKYFPLNSLESIFPFLLFRFHLLKDPKVRI